MLLFVLWYCHKRGRETRLEREKSEVIDGSGRVEELEDDPALPAPESASASRAIEAGEPTEAQVPSKAENASKPTV